MGLRSLIACVSFVTAALLASGCSKDAQKIQPDTRGKRGESCLARNDCDTGLACINGICSQNEFSIDVKAKQCTRIECSSDEDCCGDKPTEVPSKCQGRDKICDAANRLIPGCTQATVCTSDLSCNGGKCQPGICSGTYQSGAACETFADCPKNTCENGVCSLSLTTCSADLPCTNYAATCSTRVCNCVNPDYDPTAKICTDPDCTDVCLLRCSDSLCVQDKSCKTDTECLNLGLKICDGGRCVECTNNKDCDTKNDETCEKGQCHTPCKQNEECGLFEECSKGDCVYVGCKSDRECILAASRPSQQTPGGSGGSAATSTIGGGSDDPRLYRCLETAGSRYKTCKIPCENDGSCGQFQACDAGFCKFIGCENDEECRAYLGITNQMTSESKPYVATAKCEAAPDSTK